MRVFYGFLPPIPNCIRPWYLGREDGCPKVFYLWVRPFHWNFGQYLPAYLQWRTYVDSTAVHPCYPDASCGSFDVQQTISWRLRRLIRRETERIQRRLAQLHLFLDPEMPLPPPEPPPVWEHGWSWEVEPLWYYRILEPADESFQEPFQEDTRSSDWKWKRLISSFVDTYNPATIMEFVSDAFKPTPASAKLEVTVNLLDQRPYWKRIYHQVLVHAIKLPRAYVGSITNGIPLIVDTGASVCITP